MVHSAANGVDMVTDDLTEKEADDVSLPLLVVTSIPDLNLDQLHNLLVYVISAHAIATYLWLIALVNTQRSIKTSSTARFVPSHL